MNVPASATTLLGNFVASSTEAELPPEVKEKAALCLLDSIGLAILSREEKTLLVIDSLSSDIADEAVGARVWTTGKRRSLADAVMTNSVAVHAQFHDDTCYASVSHPASLVVPSAVSLAEVQLASLSECLLAIAVGYNTIAWLGANETVSRALIARGFRCSPVLGTIASAATAAKILRLDESKSISAIGIASSLSGGLLETVRSGSDEWRIQNARAASGGVLAAQLAQKGIFGAPQGLEGPKGLLHSIAGLDEVPSEWHKPPTNTAILAVVAKPWATLGDNMAAAMAAQLIHAHQKDTDDIRHIRIKIWNHFTDFPGTSYRGPFDRVPQAVASMAFATAAMLVYGDLEYHLSLNHRTDSKILRLLPLITIEPDVSGNAYDALVQVTYANGGTITKEAKEASRTLIYHDHESSAALLEQRLHRSGYTSGVGHKFANRVLEEVDKPSSLTVRQLLDELAPSLHTTS